ncbi:MAG: HAD-IA family hydrolase [Candidatus Yanofskybacteria bacterium]|nr:HAD-IA family hydrolase [Candidatus Yanofskybacteria bacterium]
MQFRTNRFYDYVRAHQLPGAINPEKFSGFDCVVDFDLGRMNRKEFCWEMKKCLEIDVGDDEFLFHYCEDVMSSGPDHKMIELKQALKQNGLKLAVVSNINECHFEYVQRKWPEVFSDFDYLALSFRVGSRKPHPRIWLNAIERLGVMPEECFFIDDQMLNIVAFEQLGKQLGKQLSGIGHHYNVVDEKYCPNGRLEIERNRLVLRMVNLGMLSWSQASEITKVNF